ncbi:MAG: acylphosphatase [Candidatus Makaraimicrobium thalassicum]|nr:MAG: acylphosphatase [Candidatus Omnitrophota bacterium]
MEVLGSNPSAPTMLLQAEIPAMAQMQRIHVLYTGTVQGVGFRFTAERIALRLGITGFVKNRSDGNVEAVCEGDRQQLEAFLKGMSENMYGYIGDSRVDWEPPRGEFSSFEIRF